MLVALGIAGCAAPEEALEEGAPEEAFAVLAVNGYDSRVESRSHENSRLRDLARGVAAIVDQDWITENDATVALKTRPLNESLNLCPNVSFALQGALPDACSGFLVADTLLATAGHCIRNEAECRTRRFVFGFEVDDKGLVPPLSKQNVYKCHNLVHSTFEDGIEDRSKADFALVRLDRIADEKVLPMSQATKVQRFTVVHIIGHPAGLPKKIATNGVVITRHDPSQPFFKTNLDTFEGNSGSPVINADTYEVEGIFTGGQDPYVQPYGQSCKILRQCSDDGSEGPCLAERVTKIANLEGWVR